MVGGVQHESIRNTEQGLWPTGLAEARRPLCTRYFLLSCPSMAETISPPYPTFYLPLMLAITASVDSDDVNLHV